MRKGGGKSKGAAFEREICKSLSLWVSKGAQEDVFWRSAMSGGRSTVAHAKGKRLASQAGDISCIHPIGHAFANEFFLECKTYRDLKIIGLIKGTGNLVEFWAEAVLQANRYEKLPLLIAKQNQQPPIVCLTRIGAIKLDVMGVRCLTAPRLDLHAVLLEDFLKRALPLDPERYP